MSKPEGRLPGWVLPTGLGILVVGLVAIALLRGPVSLDPDTPEGTVQRYLVAVSEERWNDAVEIMHEDWRGECEGADMASFAPDDFSAQLGTNGGFNSEVVRQRFDEISPDEPLPAVPEDVTELDVTIHHTDSGVFGSSWNEQVVFQLVDDADLWWIVGDPWPHFTWSCREG